MDYSGLVRAVALELGYTLRSKQEQTILAFLQNQDVFISLPTGYSKSLYYSLLPPIYDKLRNVENKSIVLVVSPDCSYARSSGKHQIKGHFSCMFYR